MVLDRTSNSRPHHKLVPVGIRKKMGVDSLGRMQQPSFSVFQTGEEDKERLCKANRLTRVCVEYTIIRVSSRGQGTNSESLFVTGRKRIGLKNKNREGINSTINRLN